MELPLPSTPLSKTQHYISQAPCAILPPFKPLELFYGDLEISNPSRNYTLSRRLTCARRIADIGVGSSRFTSTALHHKMGNMFSLSLANSQHDQGISDTIICLHERVSVSVICVRYASNSSLSGGEMHEPHGWLKYVLRLYRLNLISG